MGGPFVTVSTLLSEDDHGIMPGRLDDLGRRHHDDTGFASEMGAAQGNAEIEDHAGAKLADVGLIPSRYVNNRSIGIGASYSSGGNTLSF
jgi:hypothetical protein